ncbi:MAG: DUF3568 family protein [Desulfobacterales bacterium]
MLVKRLNRTSAILMICGSVSIFAGGCAAIQGKAIKTYHAEYKATVRASAEALKNMEIPIFDEVSDELKTEFLARRPDGTPVTVEVKRVDQNFTQVSVSTGGEVDRYFGQETAKLIHGYIRSRLSHTAKEE